MRKIASLKESICLAAESYEMNIVDKDEYKATVFAEARAEIDRLKREVKEKQDAYLTVLYGDDMDADGKGGLEALEIAWETA